MRQLEQHPHTSYTAAFASSLLNPERTTPVAVAGPAGKRADKRYNVYRNNVTVSLIDALAAVYPAVQRITGVDFFRAMARSHIRATPPNSPLLFEYGRDFPAFIEHYEYASSMPWLADTARIERAWLDAYHAADAEPPASPSDRPDIRLSTNVAPPSGSRRRTTSKSGRVIKPSSGIEASILSTGLVLRLAATIVTAEKRERTICVAGCVMKTRSASFSRGTAASAAGASGPASAA